MKSSTFPYLRVVLYAIVAWAIVLLILSLVSNAPRAAFVFTHYVANVLVFGFVFHHFYRSQKVFEPFLVTITTFLVLFVLEAVFWLGFYRGDQDLLNFVDWIVPAFLIASTIYGVGHRMKTHKQLF